MIDDELAIRGFAPEDWDALCGVYERAARHELRLTGTDPRAFRPLPDEEDLEEFQRLNTAMVGCLDGQVVGFVGWRERGEWRDSGYLSWLYVDPAHHRRGIGDRLLNAAMAALGEQAWTLAKLGNDPAVNLYRRYGMRIVTSRLADSRGHPHTELRLALPTSRKSDPDAPNFGAWVHGEE
ncbi:MAG: GNAT family N-acetyltransferase [Ilumatobacter sp.]|uniref:GNAT family N-acetyltransferase n=1 Tax=Ilumatobacter sp. TaxID=1967498 RepID=UPI002603E6F6|nr:GNAT family N-acetyltransferase [Ilumatobacter sp.]MDJ0769742.1 GNAT family N-acetyltransferase [Ilumatobacter sp.]